MQTSTPLNKVTNTVIAFYDTHIEAEEAVKEIQRSGVDMSTLSIVGKNFHMEEDIVGYYNVGDRVSAWGKSGAFWGSIWGVLVGSGFFIIPGIGPLLVAGPILGWIAGALEGALVFGGLSALGAAFYSMGIPKDSILDYEARVKAGKYAVIAHGSVLDVTRTKEAFEKTHHKDFAEHPFANKLT